MALSSSGAPKKAAHHDTHARPPDHIQEAYWHYNKLRPADLAADASIIDFDRGLNVDQQRRVVQVGVIDGASISRACTAFRDARRPGPDEEREGVVEATDRPVYEHVDFPGLQMVPSILPPSTQVELISRLLHRDLANPHHKTNIDADYHVGNPAATPGGLPENLSFFSAGPSAPDVTLLPKDSAKHAAINNVQHLQKKLRWMTLGTQYDWPTRKYPATPETVFPPDTAALVADLFPHIRAESGVVLVYSPKDYMPVHRDVSEQCERGLASFSLGCDGIFVLARDANDEQNPADNQTLAIRVRSGDVLHLDGEARWAWHAMPRTIAGTCPAHLADWPASTPGATPVEARTFARWKGFMAGKRLNISCRQVWD